MSCEIVGALRFLWEEDKRQYRKRILEHACPSVQEAMIRTNGESWSLGDSPAIALALDPGCRHFAMEHAPRVEEDTSSSECPENPVIRIYKDMDSRYILEDLIAKLELFAR